MRQFKKIAVVAAAILVGTAWPVHAGDKVTADDLIAWAASHN